MQHVTNINIGMIQPEPAYNPGDVVRTIQQPKYVKYWSLLGCSKKRTSEQQEMWQGIIHQCLLDS